MATQRRLTGNNSNNSSNSNSNSPSYRTYLSLDGQQQQQQQQQRSNSFSTTTTTSINNNNNNNNNNNTTAVALDSTIPISTSLVGNSINNTIMVVGETSDSNNNNINACIKNPYNNDRDGLTTNYNNKKYVSYTINTATSSESLGSASSLPSTDEAVTTTTTTIGCNEQHQPVSWFIVQITIIASIGGILFGYDLGVISGALPQLSTTFQLTTKQQEVAVSILYLGGGIGAAVGGTLCDSIGRKYTILVTDVIFTIGAFLLFIAPNFVWIVFGRIVVGFAVAVSGIADVSYLHEIAPVHVRGAIVSVNEACISLGFLIAFGIGRIFANHSEGWRIMFGFSGFFAIVQFIGMLPLPESPKWLQERGGKLKESSEQATLNHRNNVELMVRNATGTTTTIDNNNSINNNNSGDYKEKITRKSPGKDPLLDVSHGYQSSGVGTTSTSTNNNMDNHPILGKVPVREYSFTEGIGDTKNYPDVLLLSPMGKIQSCIRSIIYTIHPYVSFFKMTSTLYRRQCLITLFMVVTQQFCGQTNVLSYAPLIFAGVAKVNNNNNNGYKDDESSSSNNTMSAAEYVKGWSTLSIGLVKFFVTIIVIWKIEKVGRRILLLSGMTTLAIGLLFLTIAFSGSSASSLQEEVDNNNNNNNNIGFSNEMLALPGVWFVVTGYSMSFGPLTWLLTSELFPTDIRGRALGVSTIVTYISASIVASTFLSSQEVFGSSAVFAFYTVVTCLGICFAYIAIPDTGGKNPDEIDDDLNHMPFWFHRRGVVVDTTGSTAFELVSG